MGEMDDSNSCIYYYRGSSYFDPWMWSMNLSKFQSSPWMCTSLVKIVSDIKIIH